MTIVIVAQPNLIEETIANNSPTILSSLNTKKIVLLSFDYQLNSQ